MQEWGHLGLKTNLPGFICTEIPSIGNSISCHLCKTSSAIFCRAKGCRIKLHLLIVAKKHSIATITKLRSLELLIKTLLHILYHISGLTHDFWTRTGGYELDCSHGAGTSSPSYWHQVEEQAPKPVGWTMCFLLLITLVPVQKLCVNINVYIYIYICAFLIRVLL